MKKDAFVGNIYGDVPTEPDKSAANTTRISIRLPSGNRVNRRFMQDDKVRSIYAVVDERLNQGQQGDHKNFELLFGRPPKPIDNLMNKSIKDSELMGSLITCRVIN